MFFDKKAQARNFKDLTQRINLDILQEDAEKEKKKNRDKWILLRAFRRSASPLIQKQAMARQDAREYSLMIPILTICVSTTK